MTSWVYDERFLAGMQFLLRTLSFTMGEDDGLKHPAQEQEERRTINIGFKFPQGLKNTTTIFQQPTMTDPIDGLARPLIRTPAIKTRESILGEI
jgi:hypothetical protein